MRIARVMMRAAARRAAEQEGFSVSAVRGRGLLAGTRLRLTNKGGKFLAAVRTSPERLLGFSRHVDNNNWKILQSVDYVIMASPSKEASTRIEVNAFSKKSLIPYFDAALAEMERRGVEPAREIPIFIPLDECSDKNLGHLVSGIKKERLWGAAFETSELVELKPDNSDSEFIERVKREFAERVGVDVGKVTVEFRVIA